MGRASKDKRDMYYRKAKEEGYRARSAYKLLQLHEEFNILQRENILTGVVDLCAAPGSWSQVLASHLRSPVDNSNSNSNNNNNNNTDNNNNNNGSSKEDKQALQFPPRIVAVDLQEMMPIEGVCLLQGDITSEATAREIIRLLNCGTVEMRNEEEEENGNANVAEEQDAARVGESSICNTNNNNNNNNNTHSSRKADLVVCDGAPDVTGMHELDEYLQHHLLLAALNITTFVLRRGGTFVTKIFRGPNTPFLVAKSEVFFKHVIIAKPKSSRNASMEAFMVCQDYQPPAGYCPSFEHPLTTITQCFTPDAPLPPALQQQQQQQEEEEKQKQYEQEEKDKINMQTVVVPFLACGDLSGYDADMCYDRDGDAPVLPPVHPPRQAPYIANGTPISIAIATTTTATAAAGTNNTIVSGSGCSNNGLEDETKRRRVE